MVGATPPSHNEVHDLEAFFWVLVWYCISRQGPAQRRAELLPDDNGPAQGLLVDAFSDAFEGGDALLASTKTCLITDKTSFKEEIRMNVSEYCKPLSGLLKAYYSALRRAHMSHSVAGLHETIIAAFDKAETTVDDCKYSRELRAKFDSLQENEEIRRRADWPGHWDLQSPPSKGNASHITPDEQVQSIGASIPEPVSPTPHKRARLDPSRSNDGPQAETM